jgi:putative ABC transport system permease protein
VFLAIRDIRFAKGRFALMGGVVALITLLLVMLSGLTAGLSDQSTSAITGLGADQIAFGAPAGNPAKASYTESQVTPSQVTSWARTPGVASADALGIAQTRLQATGAKSGTANVAVFGLAPGSPLLPAPVSAGTVVIGQTTAKTLGIGAGDTVNLGGTALTVSSVVADEWYSHTAVVWTALPAWQQLAHVADAGSAAAPAGTVVAVRYSNGTAVDAGSANTAAGTVSTTAAGSFQALGSYRSEHGSLILMQAFLYGISALVIVAFLTVWTVQRTRDIAVLKAMGGSAGYILRDALSQAAIVLVAGAAAGGLVGIAGGFLAATAAPFLVTPLTTAVPILGIVALGLAGAALAVRRVATVDALLALGGN